MIKMTISWYNLKAIAMASPETYELLRANSKDPLAPIEEILAGKSYAEFWAWIENIIDLPDIVIKEATFEVLRPMKLLREQGMRVTPANAEELFACAQVHLPGNELLKIRKVEVRENMCTDDLQKMLDDDWKILAICPQPSRRPDYIMGKL